MPSNHAPAEVFGCSERARRPDSHRLGGHEPVSLFSPDARRLARAATDLDTDLMVRTVQASIDDIGVVSTWEQLVQPVWHYLGSQTDDHDQRVVSERIYVQSAMKALSAARRPPRLSPPSVLLACADEEVQVFPLEALVAALQESGASCCVLGARVPPYALANAAIRLRPPVVVIWSQSRETADPAQIAIVLEAHPTSTMIAAGPGWSPAELPPQAVRATDLSTALVLALAVLEGHTPPLTQPKAVSTRPGHVEEGSMTGAS
ncbi:MerR family transcriptional regulator [Actinoplanes sp. NPDC049668]|uniref:MerR family transcriptional regulator n=1 Tax=unclassified Actinoplanes TaxID=2626549 RepID=UPI0033BF2CE3